CKFAVTRPLPEGATARGALAVAFPAAPLLLLFIFIFLRRRRWLLILLRRRRRSFRLRRGRGWRRWRLMRRGLDRLRPRSWCGGSGRHGLRTVRRLGRWRRRHGLRMV